jgi:hypothetical protein
MEQEPMQTDMQIMKQMNLIKLMDIYLQQEQLMEKEHIELFQTFQNIRKNLMILIQQKSI